MYIHPYLSKIRTHDSVVQMVKTSICLTTCSHHERHSYELHCNISLNFTAGVNTLWCMNEFVALFRQVQLVILLQNISTGIR